MAFLPTFTIFVSVCLYLDKVLAYDNSYYDNVAVYWGQNSYGATGSNTAYYQQPISFYCQDDAIDALPVAFANTFFGTGGMPVLNLANTCNPTDNATFPGTDLVNCSALAADIEYCQSQGKVVTISLGGAGGGVGFTDDAEAQTFAQTIWNLFLGGSNITRPFGSAVLDGVDLDIEGGGSTGYAAFVTEIRSLASGASKPYYITGAPQCPFPDANLGSVIDQVGFDAIYVQFYESERECACAFESPILGSTFADWNIYQVKIYIGAPASSAAAGSGYVSIGNLSNIAVHMRESFPSFGGVMLWDASQAYGTSERCLLLHDACSGSSTQQSPTTTSSAAGTTTTTTTPMTTTTITSTSSATGTCSGVAAWQSGVAYTAGEEVTYGGYLWTANWWSENDTPGGSAGDWTNDGAC
ncbi:glycoside hydrolase family 18 protein [Lanmaoa asiatica]|nr:glycoside hydrolase family 18 protein [Lanmaoa asiatica]